MVQKSGDHHLGGKQNPANNGIITISTGAGFLNHQPYNQLHHVLFVPPSKWFVFQTKKLCIAASAPDTTWGGGKSRKRGWNLEMFTPCVWKTCIYIYLYMYIYIYVSIHVLMHACMHAYHTIPYHTIPYHSVPDNTRPYIHLYTYVHTYRVYISLTLTFGSIKSWTLHFLNWIIDESESLL